MYERTLQSDIPKTDEDSVDSRRNREYQLHVEYRETGESLENRTCCPSFKNTGDVLYSSGGY